ncbi:putative alpha-1,6-mannosyltransferase mnn11 [Collariella sp. IMI 366227]|nr:putative alpha-1,6-mannosyltransferase mnn11 [Collariella sp. IMI 366227]
MHFALRPERPPSRPLPPRTSGFPGFRRTRVKLIALTGLAFLTLIYLFTRQSSSSIGHATPKQRVPKGNPPVVLVTVLDQTKFGHEYLETVKENRRQYAEKHGYKTLLAKITDYDLHGAPFSWTSVVAMRDALTQYPECRYVWFLDANGLIMNPKLKIDEQVMAPARLDELMKKDVPVVPPDSIIKTFAHLRGADVDFVVTQDGEGLSAGSLVLRNGEWAKFLLETWWDPIYRSYNFQKAEVHALEHIIQWHPTILAKMAIVDQRVMNAYSKGDKGEEYREGDFVVRFSDCTADGPESCETVSQPFVQQWRKLVGAS